MNQHRTAHTKRGRRLRMAAIASSISVLLLVLASGASAGTYVIDNCASAPTPNGDPGAWTVFGEPQNTKGTCTEASGGFIGPLGASMSAASIDGVQISVPAGSGITIQEAKIWWYVPHQTSGADTFAIAAVNAGAILESDTPLDHVGTPDDFVLPSDTTELTLADYCSKDDAGNGCVIGAGESPDLELLGSQLTLSDNNLPSGSVTGGALAGTGPFSGTQSLDYDAQDNETGVRFVQLRVDGQQVAQNDYIAKCSYTTFMACPSSQSDTISWNTASVADGQHNLEVIVENAAQNTTIIHDATITTQNAPVNTMPPTIVTPGQLVVGTALSTQPGSWSAPSGAGSLAAYTYQWEDCDTQGKNCQPITGAQNANYTLAPSDVGHTLRVLVSTSDNDGQTTATSTATTTVLGAQESLGALPGPGTSNTTTGTTSTPAPTPASVPATPAPGTPNGGYASEAAQLQLGVHQTMTRTFAHSALRIPGRLLDSQGQPITAATLDVIEQIAGSSQAQVIAHARTDADGAFIVHVPTGQSRVIDIAYRAYSTDPTYAAQIKITETVSPSVRLSITPRHTSSEGTILLTGQVNGPVPKQGVIVDLLVHYRGRWEPFRTPRTDAAGHFEVAYQFEGGIGRFPFRAEVPAGQAGFPFTGGHSQIIDVATN